MAVDPLAGGSATAPSLIRAPGEGSNTISYQVAPGATLSIEAVSVDADASASGDSTITVSYLDPSGLIVAESATRNSIPGGTVCEVTFAPFLPDTADVGSVANETQLQTGLVETTLPGNSTVHIETVDAAVVLTEARIWAGGGGDLADGLPPEQLPLYLVQSDGILGAGD